MVLRGVEQFVVSIVPYVVLHDSATAGSKSFDDGQVVLVGKGEHRIVHGVFLLRSGFCFIYRHYTRGKLSVNRKVSLRFRKVSQNRTITTDTIDDSPETVQIDTIAEILHKHSGVAMMNGKATDNVLDLSGHFLFLLCASILSTAQTPVNTFFPYDFVRFAPLWGRVSIPLAIPVSTVNTHNAIGIVIEQDIRIPRGDDSHLVSIGIDEEKHSPHRVSTMNRGGDADFVKGVFLDVSVFDGLHDRIPLGFVSLLSIDIIQSQT